MCNASSGGLESGVRCFNCGLGHFAHLGDTWSWMGTSDTPINRGWHARHSPAADTCFAPTSRQLLTLFKSRVENHLDSDFWWHLLCPIPLLLATHGYLNPPKLIKVNEMEDPVPWSHQLLVHTTLVHNGHVWLAAAVRTAQRKVICISSEGSVGSAAGGPPILCSRGACSQA